MTVGASTRVTLLALAALGCVHVALLGSWAVDDAAIAWAFARNWVEGHGLVPYVGGERVEGYSDFLWVVVIAVGHALGGDAFRVAKGAAMAATVLTVPIVYRLGARVAPERPTTAGVLAAAVFVADTQVAVFGASGLENPLFSLLLAAGALWTVDEGRRQSTPWSALLFLGVALCRPEGILYGAIAGAWALAATGRSRAGAARIGAWLALFFVPFAAYHAVRYAYFAWPFPMTYYAKVQLPPVAMLDGTTPGWSYLRGFVAELGRGPALPVLALGRFGTGRAARPWLGAAVGVGAIGMLAPLPPLVFPPVLLALGVALAVPGWGRTGNGDDREADGARALCWGLGLGATLFALYAQGDWMTGYRWLSFAAVPFAVLAGGGLAEVAARVDGWVRPPLGAGVAGLGLVAFAVVNVRHTLWFAENPDFSPQGVGNRVAEAWGQWDRMVADGRPRLLTVDLGGFMWWSDMELMDRAGLVDVTYAIQGRHQEKLVQEWVSGEKRPHLVFVPDEIAHHMRKSKALREQYVDVGPQEEIRRDLMFEAAWSGTPDRRAALGSVVIEGFDVPASPTAELLYVEVGFSVTEDAPFTARVLLADATGRTLASWPIEPGYGFAPPPRWRPGEVFHGRYSLRLPADLAPGDYAVGLRVSMDGAVLRPPPEAAPVDDAGAIWWDGASVTVTPPDRARDAADALVADLPVDCAAAERAWFLARRRFAEPRSFEADHAARVRRALAACWVAHAATSETPVDDLERARGLDPAAPGVAEALAAAADAREAVGRARQSERAWRQATDAYDDALRLDPTRAWTRRAAEECRRRLWDKTLR